MNGLVDTIVIFLFLPVTVFIIIPLLMLSGWLLLKMVKMVFLQRVGQTAPEQNIRMKNAQSLPG